jgi:hypothetical protein
MATYVLPDRLSDEQRDCYLDTSVPDDLYEIARHVRENFPAAFDDAVRHTGRADVLAALTAKEHAA